MDGIKQAGLKPLYITPEPSYITRRFQIHPYAGSYITRWSLTKTLVANIPLGRFLLYDTHISRLPMGMRREMASPGP
jgi:hypothetical protein